MCQGMITNSSRIAGDFTPVIYTEDCLFEDPTIKFRGTSDVSLFDEELRNL
jgi:hypothetical protein